jgi:hypothetical protein
VLICGLFDMQTALSCGFPFIKQYISLYLGLKSRSLKKEENAEILRKASILPYITADFPPCAVVYSKKDQLRYQSMDLIERLNELNVEHLDYYAGGLISGHAFPIAVDLKRGKECFGKVINFIAKE